MRRPIRSIFASFCVACLLPAVTLGQQAGGRQGGGQIVFTRADIRIDPLPIQGRDNEATLQRPSVPYHVELRPEDALQLEYIHTLNDLTDSTGVMIAFNTPAVAPLPAMKVYTKVDALFIGDDGSILQILPAVALGELTQDIYARDPVKAFLFLKQGQAAAHAIRPHDVVVGSMFTPAPPVIQ